MTALLPIDETRGGARLIDPVAEYGLATRTFDRRPRVVRSSDYASCFVATFRASEGARLPRRVNGYRNHYTAFRGGTDALLIVRCETTLLHADNDVVLSYESIRVSDDPSNRFVARTVDWDVSFDREIAYSSARPDRATMRSYELMSSGEWWYFDKGVVLNGVSGYVKDASCRASLTYYELHPRYRVANTRRTTTMGSIRADDGRAAVVLEASARPVIRENADETTNAPRVAVQSVVPSLFWLHERSREIRRGDISYFVPRNASCLV